MRKTTLVTFIILIISSCSNIKPEERVLITSASDSVLVYNIPNAGCENCQKVIEGGLDNQEGVKQSILNLHTKQLSVVYVTDKINEAELKTRIVDLMDKMPCK